MPSNTKRADRVVAIRAMRLRHSETARGLSKPNPLRDKKFGVLRAQLNKKYKGEVFTTIALGGRETNLSAVRSGWRELDDLVTGETNRDAMTVAGSGLGWPRGRIVEIYGEEGMGKTTLTLHIIAAFQKAGELCAFVDAEHSLDVSYASKLGVDLTTLVFNQPDRGGEQALDIVTSLADSGAFGCIVVDSVAALVPLVELEADFEDNLQPGKHARLMSQALRKLVAVVARRNVLLVFINQTRLKIGVRFGNPKTTTGGQALKFYASVRIEMVNVKTQKKGGRVIFRRTRIRTVKNKCAPPFRDVFADIAPNKGIIAVHEDPGFGSDSDDE
jgi:recombination protein RecA